MLEAFDGVVFVSGDQVCSAGLISVALPSSETVIDAEVLTLQASRSMFNSEVKGIVAIAAGSFCFSSSSLHP
jgi:hypothetical protein